MSGGNDRRISKAPPPIKPVQGGSYPVPAKPETPHRPNWKEWNHTPEVRVWEACALSLDIDPHSMVHIQDGWMAGPGSGPFFEDKSFPKTGGKKEEYELRLRVLSKNLSNRAYFSRATHRMDGPYRSEVPLHEFAAWAVSVVQWNDLPSELRALAQSPTADQADEKDPQNADASIAKLFDLVGTSQLEKMFPTNADRWSKWADKAKANGLSDAKDPNVRAKFNPYRAARWWLEKQNPNGWDWARCCRVLANNLPPRSADNRHLLTRETE